MSAQLLISTLGHHFVDRMFWPDLLEMDEHSDIPSSYMRTYTSLINLPV